MDAEKALKTLIDLYDFNNHGEEQIKEIALDICYLSSKMIKGEVGKFKAILGKRLPNGIGFDVGLNVAKLERLIINTPNYEDIILN